MFERFTAESRRAVVHAQEEARLLGHDHVGSEHILLGLMSDDEGLACRVLAAAGVTLPAARRRVAEAHGTGTTAGPESSGSTGSSGSTASSGTEAPGGTEAPARRDPAAPLPFTPSAKKILEWSLRESLRQGSSYGIGTEHILLGLLSEPGGAGVAVLAGLGVAPHDVRWRVLGEISSAATAGPPSRTVVAAERSLGQPPTRVVRLGAEALAGVRRTLESIDRRLAAIEAHLGIEPGPEREPDPGTGEAPAEEP